MVLFNPIVVFLFASFRKFEEIRMYFVEKTKGQNLVKQFDYMLFLAVLLVSAIGIVVLSSATLQMEKGGRLMLMQSIGLGIGIVCALVISSIDYKDFKTLGPIAYFGSIVLLVLVLIFGVGDQHGGRSWFNFFGVSFQPSEISKIAFILIAAVFFERIKEGEKGKNILKLLIYSCIPVGLIMLQPDFGSAAVFMFAFCIMTFICEIPYKYVFISIGAFFLSLPAAWFFFLKPYQKDRIMVFIYPELDRLDKGYQVFQSKMAIGSGQMYGKGLFSGLLTHNGGIPVRESDFIFSVLGEELGFIGTIAVVVLVFFILLRCIYIAKHSRDTYGAFLVVGMASMLAFHFIENIGMCIGLLPVTGIPLPFISSGGSNMVTNYIAIGIILSVSMRRKRTIFNSTQ